MDFNEIRHQLQTILQGEGEVSYGKSIQAAASFLRKSTETSAVAQGNEPNKTEETKRLITYINANHLWNCDIDFAMFLSEGGRTKSVYQG